MYLFFLYNVRIQHKVYTYNCCWEMSVEYLSVIRVWLFVENLVEKCMFCCVFWFTAATRPDCWVTISSLIHKCNSIRKQMHNFDVSVIRCMLVHGSSVLCHHNHSDHLLIKRFVLFDPIHIRFYWCMLTGCLTHRRERENSIVIQGDWSLMESDFIAFIGSKNREKMLNDNDNDMRNEEITLWALNQLRKFDWM